MSSDKSYVSNVRTSRIKQRVVVSNEISVVGIVKVVMRAEVQHRHSRKTSYRVYVYIYLYIERRAVA